MGQQVVFDSIDVQHITGEGLNASIVGWSQSFKTGSQSLDLSEIQLEASGTNASGTFSVEIWSDHLGLPGTSLTTLNGPTHPTASLNSYLPISPFALQADTVYWVAAFNRGEDPSRNGYFWQQVRGEPTVGSHIGTAINYSGNLWEPFRESGVITYNEPMSMRVKATPEPATYLVFAIGGAALLRRGKRRRGGNAKV